MVPGKISNAAFAKGFSFVREAGTRYVKVVIPAKAGIQAVIPANH
jgi:hypothetical protein